MGDTKFCYGCFEPINDETKCPNCGYKQQSPYSPSYIAPGTTLKDKYMVGKMISHNGEGATYLAYDTVISCKVIIKEYMPDTLCTRNSETQAIVVNSNSTVQYKSLMEEFTELNKKLAKLRTIDHIQPVLDLFQENNTTYVVFEFIEGRNLMQFLKENGGELTWRKVQKLFPPLFTSISQLHNAGIIHRGISPNTIYVTDKGELKLIDFSIAAVRTNNGELTPELFKGYAAPEQYSPTIWQGTWTDVYGISSVLYRILTGCMPTEALLRNESEDLTPPSTLNCDIPDNVSEAIIKGMRMNCDERIQSINDFVTLTFKPSDDSKTATTVNIGNIASKNAREAVKKEREREQQRTEVAAEVQYDERVEARPKNGNVRPAPQEPEEYVEDFTVLERVRPAVFTLLLLIIVLGIIFFFIKSVTIGKMKDGDQFANLPSITASEETTIPAVTEVTEEDDSDGFYIADMVPATLMAPETEAVTTASTDITEFTTGANAGANIQMINFVGKIYEDVKLSSLVQDINITVQYADVEGKQKGEIIEQSVKEGTWIASGESVVLTVCRGDGDPEADVEVTGMSSNTVVKGIVPDYKKSQYSCYPLMEYLAMLDEAGIPYKAVPLDDASGYPSKGYVVGADPAPGSSVTGILTVSYTPSSEYYSVIYSAGQ